MKSLALASSLLISTLPTVAHAAAVYPGCAAPVLKSSHKTFYVDPAKGSPTNDGSAAKPWRTLAEVLDYNKKLVATKGHDGRTFKNGTGPWVDIAPKGPIKAGDVIMLKSGNHGNVTVLNSFNDDFITVMAAPGQTPVVNGLTFVSSAKWMFQGIKFLADPSAKVANGIVMIGTSDWLGASSDIIIDNSVFSSTESTSGWSDKDWTSKTFKNAVFTTGGARQCMSITNNHIYNTLNGIAISSKNSLIEGNLIEKIANDGIDMAASNLIIRRNTIKNGVNSVELNGFHADGIQGFAVVQSGVVQTNSNINIDGNTILKFGDPNKSYMQGISIFDGKWAALTIQNNVIVTNHWNGIVVSGINGAVIVNNTVLSADKTGLPTRIAVGNAKDGTPPRSITLRNNISTALSNSLTTATMDHNIAEQLIDLSTNGKFNIIKSGTVGSANKINPAVRDGFLSTNLASQSYDLRLKQSSPAYKAGSATLAPKYDIAGRLRTNPVDLGAYNQ